MSVGYVQRLGFWSGLWEAKLNYVVLWALSLGTSTVRMTNTKTPFFKILTSTIDNLNKHVSKYISTSIMTREKISRVNSVWIWPLKLMELWQWELPSVTNQPHHHFQIPDWLCTQQLANWRRTYFNVHVLGTQTWTSSNFHLNSLVTELSAQCTLQNTCNLNGHMLLASNFQGIWFSQNHTVQWPKSSFSTEEPNTKQHEMCLMSQLPPLSCYYADHSQFTPVLCLIDWTAFLLQGVRLSFTFNAF